MSINDETLEVQVIVVGAGWSGLLACKYCLSEGLSCVVLEGRDTIGGVWAYTSDARYGGVAHHGFRRWYQIDVVYCVLWTLEHSGLIWSVRRERHLPGDGRATKCAPTSSRPT